jgi:hypothetical protein
LISHPRFTTATPDSISDSFGRPEQFARQAAWGVLLKDVVLVSANQRSLLALP